MTNRTALEQTQILRKLQQLAFDTRYVRQADGTVRFNALRDALFHTIGSAEDNANDTIAEQGGEYGSDVWAQYFIGSLYAEDRKVARIINAFGIRF